MLASMDEHFFFLLTSNIRNLFKSSEVLVVQGFVANLFWQLMILKLIESLHLQAPGNINYF